MSEDQFTKLFNYMTERFDRLEEKVDRKAESEDLHRALGLLDELSKRQ